MEKLSLEKFKNNLLTDLTKFEGGTPTQWRTRDGSRSGTDTNADEDGSGGVSCGDTVTLDTGQTTTISKGCD
jgi:hypothetical protein